MMVYIVRRIERNMIAPAGYATDILGVFSTIENAEAWIYAQQDPFLYDWEAWLVDDEYA